MHLYRVWGLDFDALPDGAPGKTVISAGDFYSTSDCRDLLFHVQEYQHTLPEIAAFLAAEKLQFLGFQLDARVLRAYAALLRGKAGHGAARKSLQKIEKYGLAWVEPVARIIRASLDGREQFIGHVDDDLGSGHGVSPYSSW